VLSIGKGLYRNETLETLNVRGNSITLGGLDSFFTAVLQNSKLKLKHLDLGSNKLNVISLQLSSKDEAGQLLAQTLRRLGPLESLVLRDNSLGNEAGDQLLFLCK